MSSATSSGPPSAAPTPIVFATVKSAEILDELIRSQAVVIDLLGGHLRELEAALGSTASEQLGQYHGVGDIEQYFARMRAVEYAIEHDDGQSLRALDIADVIIIAPSRCGKTPTTMYLALQYGLLVANYPLTDDDFPSDGLPATVAKYARPLLRADHDAAAAEPGAARAPPELDLLQPRAVHPRAAPRRRPLSPQSRAVPQLLDEVGRGDVGRDHAVHAAPQLTTAPPPPSNRARRTTDRETS